MTAQGVTEYTRPYHVTLRDRTRLACKMLDGSGIVIDNRYDRWAAECSLAEWLNTDVPGAALTKVVGR